MDGTLSFLNIVGLIDAAILVLGLAYAVYLWASGIWPVVYRLGNGLATRRIAVFAAGDNLTSLTNLLKGSGVFKAKNILSVPNERELDAAAGASVYLVYWPDWGDHIDEVLARKTEHCALVVYQPYDQGRIGDADMRKLDGRRHTAVTNFRGRLLNDLVTSIITTSYEKS